MDQAILHQEHKVTTKEWIGFFGMVFGMFMAILDIQIVASSLEQVQAGLSATSEEITWIQTSYLIAEVIMIPLSGWLAETFSTRVLYFTSCLVFTIMSFFCAFAWDLNSMIVFRTLQGFFGGAMIPTVFSSIYTIFPKKMQPNLMIVIGMVVTMAPTCGPIFGGYLTEIASWHVLFLINVIPGILVCITTWLFIDVDKPNLDLLKNIDIKGIFYLTMALGGLQYVLEEGSRNDWFDSTKICMISLISLVFGILMFYRELTTPHPVINLYAFKNRNFAVGCVLSFIIGAGLYNAVFLQPMFLSSIKGLSSLQIGLYMTVTGAFQFLSAPLAGTLSRFIDLRIILFIGIILFAFGCNLNAELNIDSGFWDFFYPQMVRGISLMFCFIPINAIAYGTLPKHEIKNASGLYNLMRNLGGAIFLAIIGANISDWRKTNYEEISTAASNSIIAYDFKSWTERANGATGAYAPLEYQLRSNNSLIPVDDRKGLLASPYFIAGIKMYLSQFPNVANSDLAALKIFQGMVLRESAVIAFNNAFKMIAMIFLVGLLLIPFVEKVKQEEGDEASAGH